MKKNYFDGRPTYHRGMQKHVYLTQDEIVAERLSRKKEYIQEEDGKIYKVVNGYFSFVR